MIKLLSNIANKIFEKKIYQFIFFGLASIVTISLMGYYFGTFDQAIHIPDLKKFADSSLYPNDQFLELRNYHYSFFWLFFIPFYRAGILEITMFITHFLATFLTFYAIWELSKTLFKNKLTPFIAVIAFIFPHTGFAAFPIFEFSLLNRTFVLPFLLIAINLYLNKKPLWAYLVAGLMYNLHVVSVNFVIAMFIFDSLLRIKEVGIKNFIKHLLLFIICAAPVLIWKFSNSHVDIGLDRNWFYLINHSLLSQIFTIFSLDPLMIFIVLNGIATILIFFLNIPSKKTSNDHIIINFIKAALIIIFVQAIASVWLPLTIIIQSQIIRVGIFINFFAYLYFAGFVSGLIVNNSLESNKINLLVLALFLSPFPVLAVVVLLIYKKITNQNFIKYLSFLVILFFITSLIIFNNLNIWRPGINIFPVNDDNYKVQIWAKTHTPKDAIFITPPYLWWTYSLEWRVVSERTTVSTLSEILEGAFLPSYIDYWRPRFEDVAPGAISKFTINPLYNLKITKKIYQKLSTVDILKIAKKYHASYFISEKPYKHQLPVAYENNRFIVYDLNFINQ